MKKIEVCAAIIIKSSKIFITQRGYGDFKNKWEFPGGKIEPNETKEECIIREIKEELNAEIYVDAFLNTINYTYESFELTMHCFVCHLINEHFELLEHESAKFIDCVDLDKIDFLPADKLIFDDLKKYLRK